ncbi:DUF4153 domain-containing protein [Nonomuraea pusilla]|uniref:Signal transduction histidine-protein kinase/phosphatase MprB n=1 Tax=Nonomuraea pusilla TaxID=46177 RepID=A0A1H8AZF3_9ACTN|nr:DUF4153 domain-containing protein [Nonomuraea pusilla]SEM76105.1 Signal transduction histidine kinase [Nonomuraea pusilla]
MRPLDFLGRIKVKLGIVIVLAVGTAFVVNEVGLNSGLSRDVRIAVAMVLALIMVQVLAKGMTKPLRQLARAAQTIAKGQYALRVTATSRDEVGELARAFNAMAADLGEVDRQRRELVANVSHELRTPITGLRAVLENVVDGVSAPDPVTMRTALAQTERLGRLVAQLLDLSRLDSGVRLIEPEPVELAPLVEQAVREASLAREDVAITGAAPAGLGVRADPDLLAQVLANLLDNAVRHSPPGGLVTVTCAGDGNRVRLTVADQGPGIPVPARARVFERFSRLDSGRAADGGGAGLGLAIVKEIAELHGGTVHIADRPGCHMVATLPGRTHMGPTEAATAGDDPGDAMTGDTAVTGADVPEPAAARAASQDTRPSTTGAPAPAGAPTAGAAAASPPAGVLIQYGAAAPAVRSPGAGAPGDGGDGARRRMARMIGGGALGVLAGLVLGMFVALLVTMMLGVAAGFVALVVCVGVTGSIGAALGDASARAAAPAPPGAGQYGPPGPGQYGPTGPGQYGPPGPGQYGPPGPGGAAPPPPGPTAEPHGPASFRGGGTAPQAGAPRDAGAASLGGAGDRQGSPPVPAGGVLGGPPGYVPPPLFPRPDVPDAPRWLLPAAAGAGVCAAVALPGAGPGLGVVLAALVPGLAALPAILPRMTPWAAAFGLTGYGLIAMAAVRDAGWLVSILLLAGAALVALAVSGAGRGWIGVIRGVVSVLLALGPVAWFLAGPVKGLTARRRIMPTLAGLGIAAVLLLVFGVLFASADPVFASYAERLTTAPEWLESAPLRAFLFVVFAVLLAAVVLVALRPVADPPGPEAKFSVGRSVWLVPLTAVNLLFAAFVVVQVTALFGGDDRVLRTVGLTYAAYARQGFFQLVAVSVVVLGIVAVAAGLLRTERGERRLLAGQLGVLCSLTMVVLASALHRMHLYIDAYGLSRLRLSVEAAVWWLGAVFALVLVAGALRLAGRGSGWLPRAVVLVTALGLGAFALVNPDLRVARTQVEVRGVTRIDADYLGDLGAEAVPALDRLPEPQRSCVLADLVAARGLDRPDPWNGWNLARAQARELLARRPVTARSCGSATGRGSD